MNSLTPHGPGFSFVDSFDWEEPGKALRTQKWLAPDLPFFQDHFPGHPLMPGVLLVECGAQAAGLLWGKLLGGAEIQPFRLAQIVAFKLIGPVVPNQTVESVVRLEKDFGNLAQFQVEIRADQSEVATGRLVLAKTGLSQSHGGPEEDRKKT